MPLATSDPCMPIPGLAKEPPAPDPSDPTKAIPDNDPFGHAYDELFNNLLLLINDYPGAWASWESPEKRELFHPKIVKEIQDAHAVTWVVYEQLLHQINDLDGDDESTKSRIVAEGNRLNSHRTGPRIDNQDTITACKGFSTQNALDRLALELEAD
eukprot:7353220-Pyramimonas_sp.AAC.1